MQEAEKRAIQLIETREDTTKMLNFVDETLDQMTLTIQPFVVLAQNLAALMRRNHGFDPGFKEIVNEMGCRVASVSDQTLEINAFKQKLRLRNVMALSCAEEKAQRIAQAVHQDMDFATETTTTAPQGLFTVFFRLLPRKDAPAQSCYPSCRFPDQDHR